MYQQQYYVIKSKLSGHVLEPEGGGFQPNSKVTPQAFAQGKESQLWFDDHSSGTIRNKASNFCLDLTDDKLVVKPFQPNDPNQQWMRQEAFIKNKTDQNRVLDIYGEKKDIGATVGVYSFNGNQNQQWEFQAVAAPPGGPHGGGGYPGAGGYPQQSYQQSSGGYPGVYPAYPGYPGSGGAGSAQPSTQRREFFIVSEMHGKVLDISGAKTEPGVQLIMWDKHNPPAKNQLWYLDHQGCIRSALNDLGFGNEEKCQKLKTCGVDGNPRSQWSFQGNKLCNRLGECIDICRENKDNGAEVISYDFKDQANQKWKQEYV